jgi:hypothetical protein
VRNGLAGVVVGHVEGGTGNEGKSRAFPPKAAVADTEGGVGTNHDCGSAPPTGNFEQPRVWAVSQAAARESKES